MGYATCDEHVYLDKLSVTKRYISPSILLSISTIFPTRLCAAPAYSPDRSNDTSCHPETKFFSVVTDISHNTYSTPFQAREHRKQKLIALFALYTTKRKVSRHCPHDEDP